MQPDQISSVKDLAHFAADLQDSEVTQIASIVGAASRKYSTRIATIANLEALRDEILTRLSTINILATVDVAPVLNGEPPTVEIIGKVAGDSQHKYGMDHERKQYEVRKATARGEEFLGQKETGDSTSAQRRAKSARG